MGLPSTQSTRDTSLSPSVTYEEGAEAIDFGVGVCATCVKDRSRWGAKRAGPGVF